jgi:O-antigen ligase
MSPQSAPPVIVMEPNSASGYRLEATAPAPERKSRIVWPLLGLMMFAPLAFGAVEPWAIAILQCGAMLLLVGWVAEQTATGRIQVHRHPLLLPALLFGAVIFTQVFFGLTSYWYASYQEFLRFVAYGALLFIATQVFRSGTNVRRLGVALSIFGGALALLALAQDLTSEGLLYWVRRPRFGGDIYGPYVNRNHYAGLMELLTPFPLVLALSHRFQLPQRLLFAGTGALMAATIVLSGSRGGMLALFAELVFVGAVLLSGKRNVGSSAGLGAFLAAFIGLLFWLDASAALKDWTYLHVTDEASVGRWAITRDALAMFLQKPLLGFGLGTFPVVYPQFRSFYTDFFINQAHNDVVQVLVETGIIGGAAMVWFVVAMYRGAFQRCGAHSFPNGGLHFAALAACTGMLVHSFFDFNLHIPANAAMFFVLAAVAAQRYTETAR